MSRYLVNQSTPLLKLPGDSWGFWLTQGACDSLSSCQVKPDPLAWSTCPAHLPGISARPIFPAYLPGPLYPSPSSLARLVFAGGLGVFVMFGWYSVFSYGFILGRVLSKILLLSANTRLLVTQPMGQTCSLCNSTIVK